MRGWDFVENFTDDVKLSGLPSKVLSPSVTPWKKSNLVFSRSTIKDTAQSLNSILKHMFQSTIWLA